MKGYVCSWEKQSKDSKKWQTVHYSTLKETIFFNEHKFFWTIKNTIKFMNIHEV